MPEEQKKIVEKLNYEKSADDQSEKTDSNEVLATPERSGEITPSEADKSELENEASEGDEPGGPGSIIAASRAKTAQEERIKQIERVLEKDLDDIYLAMAEPKKQEFRTEGEKATREISALIEQGKATAKKIIQLIKDWLALIPGVNKYFLEQEAKIKADEIIKLNHID